jgi:hypothetical protein
MREVTTHSTTFDQDIVQRVCAEFLEMPGLNLTSRQARRLWGIDETMCLDLLEFLVDEGFLCRRGEDLYIRRTEGRATIPRMAKVDLVTRGVDRRHKLSA